MQEVALVLEGYAGEAEVVHAGQEVVEAVGGFGGGEALGADVADAVAVGVGGGGGGGPGEVGAEAVGGGEAGAFAEEDQDG